MGFSPRSFLVWFLLHLSLLPVAALALARLVAGSQSSLGRDRHRLLHSLNLKSH